jgi:hypothetical protein
MDFGGAYACARNSRPRPVVAFEIQGIVCFVGCCRGYSSVQPSDSLWLTFTFWAWMLGAIAHPQTKLGRVTSGVPHTVITTITNTYITIFTAL